MTESKRLFHDLVNRVEQTNKFTEILACQQLKYHLQPFKIQGIDCHDIRRIYDSIENKYEVTQQLDLDPHNWNENERRVFIWFIIFYSYFLEQEAKPMTDEDWDHFSRAFFNKRPEFLRFQFLNMIKPQGKISWSQNEDQLLVRAVGEEEGGKWNEVAKNIFFNSGFKFFKSPKHCRERWLNHLDSNKKRGEWTAQEDLAIFKFVAEQGKRWCKIVPVLRDTRTEHMIKNRYNSLLSKQRRSKKEREEHLIQKIIKQLKKQINNAELRKKRKEQNAREGLSNRNEEAPITDEKQEDLNASQEKESKESLNYLKADEEAPSGEKSNKENSTVECINNSNLNSFPMYNQSSYYPFGQEMYMPYGFNPFPPMLPYGNFYWM